MIEFLKKHNQKIDFALLFFPVLAISFIIWDGSYGDNTILEIDNISNIVGNETKNYYIKIGHDLWEYIGMFMPFVLWRIFASYWLK